MFKYHDESDEIKKRRQEMIRKHEKISGLKSNLQEKFPNSKQSQQKWKTINRKTLTWQNMPKLNNRHGLNNWEQCSKRVDHGGIRNEAELTKISSSQIHQGKRYEQFKHSFSVKEENYRDITHVFLAQACISGLHIVAKIHHFQRRLFMIFFIFIGLYCLYQCKLHLNMYFTYITKTSITEKFMPEFDFPSITICPMRPLKKSKFGNLDNLAFSISIFYANTMAEINELLLSKIDTCNNHNNLSSIMKFKESNIFNEMMKNGDMWVSNDYFIKYQDYLRFCKWNGKNFPCGDAFVNHITDILTCFTFNPGAHMAKFLMQSKTGNGINLAKYSEKNFTRDQAKNVLQLAINVQQSESCGYETTKRGAGVFFQVHDTNRQPSFLLYPSTSLSPGYDIKVFMEPTIYRRETENLQRCANFVPLYLTQNQNSTVYEVEFCYLQCVTEHVLFACKCYPPNIAGFNTEILKKVVKMGLSTDYAKICLSEQLMCLKQWIYNVLNEITINKLCPYCKQPCLETKYSIQTTMLSLSTQNLKLSNLTNATFADFRKNYIIASFMLKSNNIHIIVEQQAFTLKDLFIYIGNNLCLYLGMSFVATFEIVYFIWKILALTCKRYKSKYSDIVQAVQIYQR